ENALSLHVHKVTLNPKRDLDVFFFTGPARTGKSHFATWLAKQTNPEQPPGWSASNNDPWEGYHGEQVMVLDDFRDSGRVGFDDFLKMSDKNYRSPITSRNKNRIFLGDTLIITSVINFTSWYASNTTEQRLQLYSRLQTVAKFTEDVVYFYEWNPDLENHVPAGSIYNQWSEKNQKIQKVTPLKERFGKLGITLEETFNPNVMNLKED
ncbi:MAG: hypothetical protein E4H06_02230, partial [Methanosarcina sp.]